MSLVIESFLLIVVLVCVVIAVLVDLKTLEVPDLVSYGLIITSSVLQVLNAVVERDFMLLKPVVFSFVGVCVFANLMYFCRQWGGGDTKLAMGLGIALGRAPSYLAMKSILPFSVVVFVNVMLLGAVYGLVYSLVLGLKNRKSFAKEFFQVNKTRLVKGLKVVVLSVVLVGLLLNLLIGEAHVRVIVNFVLVFMLLMPYLYVFTKAVERACMYKSLRPSLLTPGDWVEEDVYAGKELVYEVKPYGVEARDIQKMVKEKIWRVKVKEGIPFTPAFLFGILVTLLVKSVVFFGV